MDAVHLVKIHNLPISVFDIPTKQIHLLNYGIFTKQLKREMERRGCILP